MRGDLRGPTLPGSLLWCAGCQNFVPVLIDQGDGRFRCAR